MPFHRNLQGRSAQVICLNICLWFPTGRNTKFDREMRIAPLLLCLSLAVSPVPALAESAAESVARQLSDYGYHSITSRRTLLGRIRITAERDGITREIVINRWTGAIMLDRFIGTNRSEDVLADGPSRDDSLPQTEDENDHEEEGDEAGDHSDSPDSPDGGEADEEDEKDEDP